MSDLGEVVPLGVVIRDEAGLPVDAEVVRLLITLPDDTVVMPPVTNPPPVVGSYAVDYVPRLLPGLYVWRWEATRPDLVLEGSFHVDAPGAVGVLSLEEAKDVLRIPLTETRHDGRVMNAVRAATRLAQRERHEVFMRTPVSETRDLGRSAVRGVSLSYRPVMSLTSVTRLDAAGLPVETSAPPEVAVDEHGIVTSARLLLWGRVRFDYVAGYRVLPEDYREAVGYILQAVWSNRGGSTGRPRVGGQQAGEDQAGEPTSVPQMALDLLGNRGPLVG